MSILVGLAIKGLLEASKAVVGYVDNKIYPVYLTKDEACPFILYRRASVTPNYTKDKYSTGDEVVVEISVLAEGYGESVEIAQVVRDALEKRKYEDERITINDIIMVQAQEDFVEGVYVQVLTFKIKTI